MDKKDILDKNGSGLEPEMLKECRYPEMTDQLTLNIPILRQYISPVVVLHGTVLDRKVEYQVGATGR